jgi:hypothetical protein
MEIAGLPKENMMSSYPFYKLATFSIGLGICVGCNNTDTVESDVTSPSHDDDAIQAASDTDHPTINNLIALNTPILIEAAVADFEITSDSATKNGFELNIDQVEILEPVPHGEALPCQIEYLMIDDLGGAHPVDLSWFDGRDTDYEVYVDIIEPEFKQTVGTILQTSLDMVAVDLSDKLVPGQDYLLNIEVIDLVHGDVCLADGLIRFDPVDEL